MIPSDSIPLFIRCPGQSCDSKAIYWHHTRCHNKVFIDGNADIYCGGTDSVCKEPSTRFILNWFFKCNKDDQHHGQYFRFDTMTLSFAISSVISIAGSIDGLSLADRIKLQKIYLKMSNRLIIESQKEIAKLDNSSIELNPAS